MKKHYDFIYPGDQGCSDSQTGSLNGKKKILKRHIFEPFLWNTHVLALSFLNIIKENWENAARNVFWAFLVYLQMCFCFFPKQWDFQTKRTGTLLWVSWLFSVHVSLAFPSFKQRLLYIVYEVELRANIITVSCSELTPTKPPSAVLQQDFMSSCSPAPEVWLCPSSAQSSESLDSTGQDCEQCCSENTPCLTQTGLHSWNPGALSGEGECSDFQWPSESEEGKQQLDLDPDCGQDTVQSSEIKVVWRKSTWKK